jgi:hypothetical protein
MRYRRVTAQVRALTCHRPQIVLKCADLRSSDLFAELDEAFSKLFTKSDDSTYVLGLVSETGELRIDDICKVTLTLEESVITDELRIF